MRKSGHAHAGKPLLTPLVRALREVFRQASHWKPARHSHPARRAAPAANAIRFEALEPRVLLAGDVNPAALTISGAIDVPGEKDQYEFTVQDPTRIVFDSLTNNSNLSWSLVGPDGSVASSFFNFETSALGKGAVQLGVGKYQLTVDGTGDTVGAYSLRAIDATTAADMTPGTAVSGTLDDGKKNA